MIVKEGIYARKKIITHYINEIYVIKYNIQHNTTNMHTFTTYTLIHHTHRYNIHTFTTYI